MASLTTELNCVAIDNTHRELNTDNSTPVKKQFICTFTGCTVSFTRKDSLDRHIKSVHEGITELCKNCNKQISFRDRARHAESCQKTHSLQTNLEIKAIDASEMSKKIPIIKKRDADIPPNLENLSNMETLSPIVHKELKENPVKKTIHTPKKISCDTGMQMTDLNSNKDKINKISTTLKDYNATPEGKQKKQAALARRSQTMAQRKIALRQSLIEKPYLDCAGCGKKKHTSEFNRKEKSQSGYQSFCVVCMNESKKGGREENKTSGAEFLCDICGRSFDRKDSVPRHKRTQHSVV